MSFAPDAPDRETPNYNYGTARFPAGAAPGLSVSAQGRTGTIFHSYSSYARDLDMLNTAYNDLDLLPKGRDEDGLPATMAWVRHPDDYGASAG